MKSERIAAAGIFACILLMPPPVGGRSSRIPATIREIYVEQVDVVSADLQAQMLNAMEAAESKRRAPCFNVVSDRRQADAILIAESRWDARFARPGDLIYADAWLSDANNLSVLWQESAVPLRNDGTVNEIHVSTSSVRRDLYHAAACSTSGLRKRRWW